MPWNDYPLTSITIPADHLPNTAYIYVGNNDPVAESAGVDSAIVFHFGYHNSAFLLGVEDFSFPDDDEGHFQLTAYSDQQLNPLQIIYVDWNPFLTNGGFSEFGDNSQGSETWVVSNIGLKLTVQQNDLGYVRVNDSALCYGLQATSVTLTTSSALLTGETVVASLPSTAYPWERAYRVRVEGQFTPTTAAAYCVMRVRKTNTAGQILGEFGAFPVSAAGIPTALHGSRVFQAQTFSSVTATLVITMQTIGGTSVMRVGTATAPFTVSVEDCGPASFYPNAPTLV
jgi:hypothetical protein